MTEGLFALVGVAVGVVLSGVSQVVVGQVTSRRQAAERYREQRLDAYKDFMKAWTVASLQNRVIQPNGTTPLLDAIGVLRLVGRSDVYEAARDATAAWASKISGEASTEPRSHDDLIEIFLVRAAKDVGLPTPTSPQTTD